MRVSENPHFFFLNFHLILENKNCNMHYELKKKALTKTKKLAKHYQNYNNYYYFTMVN